MRQVHERSTRLPWTVLAVIVLLAFYTYREFRADSLPALVAQDLEALWEASIDVVFAIIIMAGLLLRRTWAWWFAVFGAIGQLVLAIAGMVLFYHPDAPRQVADPQALMKGIATIGAIGILSLFFLFQRETRTAFRK